MLLLAVETATALFLGGLALIVAVLLRRVLGKPARARSASGGACSLPLATVSTRHEMPQDMSRWEVHMHEVARDLLGTLDSKIGILNQLVIDADRRIAMLAEHGSENGLAAQRAAAMQTPIVPQAKPTSTAVDEKAPDAAEQSRIVTQGEDEIYRLADAGYGGAAIAALTQSPLGDIEMILSLRSSS